MAQAARSHVVAIAVPLQGHMNPMMELCKQLAAKGSTVTFLNTDLNHLRILLHHSSKQHTNTCFMVDDAPHQPPLPPIFQYDGLDIRLMSIGDGLPTGRAGALEAALMKPPTIPEIISSCVGPTVESALEQAILKLMRAAGEPPITCIVSDMRLMYTQDVANRLGVPRVAFWTQSAASFSTNLVVTNGYTPPADDTALITCIPGAPPHKRSDMSALLIADPSTLSYNVATRPFHRLQENAWILLNGFDEMEASAMEALKAASSKILTVGPLITTPFFNFSINPNTNPKAPQHADVLNWLDKQALSSVLYVSFGTLAERSADQVIELAQGLEASGQPFLWVIRSDILSASPDIATNIKQCKEGRALVVEWAPQPHILSHPSIGGFLTHCGWNSILESIMSGVPMLTWPSIVDQGLNAKCIANQWMIGLELHVDEGGCVGKAEVEKKVLELMKEESRGTQLRQNVAKIRDSALKAIAIGGSSHANLEVFEKWLMGISSSRLSPLSCH